MVPTRLKHFLTNRNRLKAMSVWVVCGGPHTWRPHSCSHLVLNSGLCAVALRVELGERRKRWKIRGLISSRKTLYMLAGYSYSNQNNLNFSLCFESWAWILPWTKWMWLWGRAGDLSSAACLLLHLTVTCKGQSRPSGAWLRCFWPLSKLDATS